VLYVGNLHENVTCEILAKVFSKFGGLQSVKLMQPRNEAERNRKRLCAFVKYLEFLPSFIAKQNLSERILFGQAMKIVWSRNIAPILR
jgi:RNA recognition motif-containing protein